MTTVNASDQAIERRARALLALGYQQTSRRFGGLRSGDVVLTVDQRTMNAMRRLGLKHWGHNPWPRDRETAYYWGTGPCGHMRYFGDECTSAAIAETRWFMEQKRLLAERRAAESGT